MSKNVLLFSDCVRSSRVQTKAMQRSLLSLKAACLLLLNKQSEPEILLLQSKLEALMSALKVFESELCSNLNKKVPLAKIEIEPKEKPVNKEGKDFLPIGQANLPRAARLHRI